MAPNFSSFASSLTSAMHSATDKIGASSRSFAASVKPKSGGVSGGIGGDDYSGNGLRSHDDAEDGLHSAEDRPAYLDASGGVGSQRMTDEELEVSLRDKFIYSAILFFTFLGICCFAAVAGFQSKWKIGVSGLTGFALFLSLATFIVAVVLFAVPLIYHHYDKLRGVAQFLHIDRTRLILEAAGVLFTVILSLATLISAFTQKGCKDAKLDPHAEAGGDDFVAALPGWCRTKQAGSIFFLLGSASWCVLFSITFLAWRGSRGKGGGIFGRRGGRGRDKPFQPPVTEADFPTDGDDAFDNSASGATGWKKEGQKEPKAHEEQASDDDEASPFNDRRAAGVRQQEGGAGRPSMDAYGAFGGAIPEGYGGGGAAGSPAVSRTMQLAMDPHHPGHAASPADPFADVRRQLISPPPQLPQIATDYYHPTAPASPHHQPSYHHPPPPQSMHAPYQPPTLQTAAYPPDPYHQGYSLSPSPHPVYAHPAPTPSPAPQGGFYHQPPPPQPQQPYAYQAGPGNQ